jgi:hypothetical protein
LSMDSIGATVRRPRGAESAEIVLMQGYLEEIEARVS